MPTLKLFHADPYATRFAANVLSCAPVGESFDVILDQTLFYATAGGQPHDTGTLGGRIVLGVTEEDGGTIIHRVTGPLTGAVDGEIDGQHRLDHMEQHTGQHLLSGAFEQLYNAETLSWHLGATSCGIDLGMESLSTEQAERVERECNRVIRGALPIITHLVTQAEVENLPLRKPPKVTENIRVVEISGYDWSACAGTHVQNTAELGLLKIKSWEKHKKGVRVEFLVGDRALSDYIFLDRTTRELGRSLSIGAADLPVYVQRSYEEIAGLRKQVKALQERILEIEAADLVKQGHRVGDALVVLERFGGRAIDELKLLASKVAAHPGAVAIFGTRGAMPQLVIHRAVDVRMDAGAVIRKVLPLIDGRGGGSPVCAQGGGSRPEALEQALSLAVTMIAEMTHA